MQISEVFKNLNSQNYFFKKKSTFFIFSLIFVSILLSFFRKIRKIQRSKEAEVQLPWHTLLLQDKWKDRKQVVAVLICENAVALTLRLWILKKIMNTRRAAERFFDSKEKEKNLKEMQEIFENWQRLHTTLQKRNLLLNRWDKCQSPIREMRQKRARTEHLMRLSLDQLQKEAEEKPVSFTGDLGTAQCDRSVLMEQINQRILRRKEEERVMEAMLLAQMEQSMQQKKKEPPPEPLERECVTTAAEEYRKKAAEEYREKKEFEYEDIRSLRVECEKVCQQKNEMFDKVQERLDIMQEEKHKKNFEAKIGEILRREERDKKAEEEENLGASNMQLVYLLADWRFDKNRFIEMETALQEQRMSASHQLLGLTLEEAMRHEIQTMRYKIYGYIADMESKLQNPLGAMRGEVQNEMCEAWQLLIRLWKKLDDRESGQIPRYFSEHN